MATPASSWQEEPMWSTSSIQPCTGAVTAYPRSADRTAWLRVLLHPKEKRGRGEVALSPWVEIRAFLLSVQGTRSHCNFSEVSYFILSGLLFSLRLTQHLQSELMAGNCGCTLQGGRMAKDCSSTGIRGGSHAWGPGELWRAFAPVLNHNGGGEEHGNESWVDEFFAIPHAGKGAWLGRL